MGEIRQSIAERQRLITIWYAHPNVKQFRSDVYEFSVTNRLKFNKAGMDAVNKFAATWMAECDDWPHSGILIG